MALFRKHKEEETPLRTSEDVEAQNQMPGKENLHEQGSESFENQDRASDAQEAPPKQDSAPRRIQREGTPRGTVAPIVPAKSPLAQNIEHIMEAELGDFYLQLNPREQLEFKRRGEETATAIERLIVTAKVTVQKVFQLIASWLRIIPHVNRYYLEQEAKIKADRIMREIVERRSDASRVTDLHS